MQTLQSKDTGFSFRREKLSFFVELCSDPFYKSPDADVGFSLCILGRDKLSFL